MYHTPEHIMDTKGELEMDVTVEQLQPVIGCGSTEVPRGQQCICGVNVPLVVVERTAVLALDRPRVRRHGTVIVRDQIGRRSSRTI